jgi:transcriptional regulator with GAF, ATPase, and Fis domain
MAKLIVIDGPDLGCEHELERPAGGGPSSWTAGRDPRAEICLADSSVSREHCRIEATPRGFRVIDLGSRNRTFLNGDPIGENVLRDGDILALGDTELRFVDDSAPVEMAGMASTIIKAAGAGTTPPAGLLDGIGARRLAAGKRSGLEQAIGRMRRMVEVALGMAGTTSARELLDRFLTGLAPLLGADNAAFLVREGERWAARSQAGSAPRAANGAPLRASLSIVDRARSERKALLSASTAEDERFRDKQSVLLEEIHSAIAVPILRSEEVAGVLYADRRGTSEPFDEEALDLLRAAAEPLGAALERLEEQARLQEENRNLMRSITETRRIIGRSAAVRNVFAFIERAAPTSMTVLIEGETGTGKELVASAVHYASPRRGRPFVAINCAALPENLIESELFGHERGAFTGAVSRKKGRFELASGGTAFLDEVGELTLPCQAKLLRLLEERSFERVGGVEPVAVDVRIIAATNKDLQEAVSRGEFREDLFYRLNVLNIKLPPLRDRVEDIPLLVEHFLARQAEAGRPRSLGKAAAEKLQRYAWPGNIRQLRNVIESAIVLGGGREIRAEDLVLPEHPGAHGKGDWRPISLEELERRHILKVLEHTKGNKKRAAEILGIERCTLYSKLRSYEEA